MSSENNSFDMLLKLENIGPHENTKLEKNLNSINMAIYANNGSGKSFISKSFKRVSDMRNIDGLDESIENIKKKTTAMVRFEETCGNMMFSIKPQNKEALTLNVGFSNESLPQITDTTKLIYHVFNSEYIKENLEAVKYNPEDNISGFILGKSNIDLSKEKESLNKLENSNGGLKEIIENSVLDAQKQLRSIGVQRSTREFLNISFQNVFERKATEETRSFEEIFQQYNTLKSMPENIQDIIYPLGFSVESINDDLASAQDVLNTSFTLSLFADEFKNSVKMKQSFIETGLSYSDGRVCPFCGQEYDEKAINLIDMYTRYMNDSEAATIKKIDKIIEKLENHSSNFDVLCSKCSEASSAFDSIKLYFPSYHNRQLECIDVTAVKNRLSEIIQLLKNKRENIASCAINICDTIKSVLNETKNISAILNENSKLVTVLNSNKNNIANERLLLRKALCNSKLNFLISQNASSVTRLNENLSNIEKLKKEIEERESQAKIDKRATLIKELQRYLKIFFGGKYEFDEKKFCIRFKNRALVDDTDNVLSDGEKSILAFCFYLANIHGIVQKESDYSKLMLVIDDPVSSMDYNYVYNVAQVIRDLKNAPYIERLRYIILTHNMEFMSILVRNKIVKQKYLFSDGQFLDFKDDYIMPYTSNLKDIYEVSQGIKKPTHTTPHSIRHVLETIQRFAEPTKDFQNFITDTPILNDSGFLYTFINDYSHGGFRIEKGYTDDMVIDACSIVVEYISNVYQDQIEEIKHLLNNTIS